MTTDDSAEVSRLRSEVASLKHQVDRASGLSDRVRTVEQTVEPALDRLERSSRRRRTR